MIVMLIAACRPPRRSPPPERIEQTLGPRQTHQDRMQRRCLEDIIDIKEQIAAGGVTSEKQARAVRFRDVKTAHRIVSAHILPEWRASEEAPQAMEALAQAIANAMQTARGATTSS
jgi:hypothetical protein